MTGVDAFLTNCRLADGRLVDVGIAGWITPRSLLAASCSVSEYDGNTGRNALHPTET